MPIPLPALRRRRRNKAPASPESSSQRYLAGDLCELLEGYLRPEEVKQVYDAYLFSAEAHEGQKRRSGEPYIYHPVEVARILGEMRLDAHTITAAILHDVVEDTGTHLEQIREHFGADVAELVDGVSKIDKITFTSREEAQAENFRKMLMAMANDIRVIIIKLADRTHNMRTIGHMPRSKQRAIGRETLEIYAPIANRLGIHQWSQELQDLSFAVLYPLRYRSLREAVRGRQGNRKAVVDKIQVAIVAALKSDDLSATVSGREKNVYSTYKKMKAKHLSFQEVHDVLGFRIVVPRRDMCYRALGVVHGLYKPIPGKFKDYIAIPKANGYQSLHTVVFGPFGQPLEIQIRTEEMHQVSDVGVAAHWRYKTGDGAAHRRRHAHELARKWLVDLLDTQRDSGDSREFLEHLRIDLFPDEVYVFTPKGEIKKLPRGATALDFAYSVHTDVGNRCVGALVNHKPVALKTRLRNGDHVQVQTSVHSAPHPGWLGYVVTGKARAMIRNVLKGQRRRESVRLGRRLLKKATASIDFKKATSAEKNVLLRRLKLKEWDDLLADIGMGNRMSLVVARQLAAVRVGEDHADPSDSAQPPLIIRGTEGMLVTLSRCCRPIPGDPILGFLTPGKGIVVHTNDCPNVAEYRKRPETWIDVNWEPGIKGIFPASIRIEARNQRGVLASLAAIIAEAEANIDNVSMTESDSQFSTMLFTMEVRNRRHLATILRQLRAQEPVVRINRVKG